MLGTSTHVSISRNTAEENRRRCICIGWTDVVLLLGRAAVILLRLEGMLSDGVVVVGM